MTTQEAVKLWKELGITECEMEFSCGGDSMNDYSFNFFKGSEKIESDELNNFFEDEVFKRVEFYVNSDGHYIGESGKVIIELDEDYDDEEDYTFSYSKSAQAEFSERFTSVGEMKLTKKELEFLQKNVSNINGGDGEINFNFKRDFILTDEDEKTLEELKDKVDTFAVEFEVEGDGEGDASDWYSFTTSDEENDETPKLTFEDNKLVLRVSREFYVYRDSAD